MSDLDIQIDVPDDDDLSSPVRVLNGSGLPPMLKPALLIVGGLVIILLVAAFLVGRSRPTTDDLLTPPTVVNTTLESAVASRAIDSTLTAVQGWEDFARTGDLAAVSSTFDPDGPQYSLFTRSAGQASDHEIDFTARNLTETTDGVVTTVSMDLVVTEDSGQTVYPYDFIYLDGRSEVWTVVDRRSPGTAAVPPAAEMIDSARQSWILLISSMEVGDGQGVLAVVSPETELLASQIQRTMAGEQIPNEERLVADPTVYDGLVERARASGASEPGGIIIALFDADQRQAMTAGELRSWTQIESDRIIASLNVAGADAALVPFVASTEGWMFDLVGALNTSGGNLDE